MKLLNKLISTFLLMAMAISIESVSIKAQTPKIIPGTFAKQKVAPNSARASVVGLQQYYSVTGHYTLSADGIGSTSSSMSIRVNKPNAHAIVQKAILISSVTGASLTNSCVTIAGVPVNLDGSASGTFFTNYWADVTSIVAPQINNFPAGISTLNITECNIPNRYGGEAIDGEALLVVFNNATATENTIVIMLGAENLSGNNFSVTLAKPINPNQPRASLDMGLGIGYSFQGFDQFSEVSVNGERLTSSAGGQDDGEV